jgi:GNAT superfamily N-acetyltransferase
MQLRPATLDDAAMVADLETARTPDDPHDAAMTAYWWTHAPEGSRWLRLVGEIGGAAVMYVEASHDPWTEGERLFGWVTVSLHPDAWTAGLYREGTDRGEAWLRSEGAEVAAAWVRQDFGHELAVMAELGYHEERRERYWELDLVGRREDLLATAERSRVEMLRQGVEVLTLDRADDTRTLHNLYELDITTTRDIPTTVPIYTPAFEEWQRNYFENPGVRKDRFWIARVGDDVAGLSVIIFPPDRGVPSTWYTATSATFRGRSIARALKYETVAQAIEMGATRIRTDNDSANAPILHINEEMGYQPITPWIELHRSL